jgi:hypothetical protein
MNYEGTDITTPKSTVTIKSDDPNVTIEGKLIHYNDSGTTGTSGSSGPRPAKDSFKEINEKYHFKGKYPKPR